MSESKVAVVTGAASGIGRAIAARFAADGFRVVGIDIQKDRLKALAEEISAKGSEFHEQPFDLAQTDRIPALVDGIIHRVGRVDVLVNDAYTYVSRPFIENPVDESWERVMRVNVTAVAALSQCCARDMARRTWGRIINLSSLSADFPSPGDTAYAASKGAVNSLTKSTALALVGMGIRVNAVSVAVVDTPAWGGFDELKARSAAKTPIGRMGRPEEVAAAVAFLASDEADFFVGSILQLDGGFHLR